MPIIGLDVGDVRVGVAVSDDTHLIARVVMTYTRKRYPKDVKALAKVCQDLGATAIVSGLPYLENGDIGPQAVKAQEFSNEVARIAGLPIYFQDERGTSVYAEEILLQGDVSRKKRKGKIDQVAAVLILQNYLDDQKEREKKQDG